jgi:hypothetical protein
MNEYQKKLEEFRFLYFTKYGVKLDDEVLYFFIRVNEMQLDLKKQIKDIPKLTYRSHWDYFLHGLGRFFLPTILIISFVVFIQVLVYNNAKNNVVTGQLIYKNGQPFLQLKYGDSLFYLQVKQMP